MTKKSRLLGLPFGTAMARLRKQIMFMLVEVAGLNSCYRCHQPMSVDTISIEHKAEWERAANPSAAFFDLDNITFSHLRCNLVAKDSPPKIYSNEKERHRAGNRRYYARNKERINAARRKVW